MFFPLCYYDFGVKSCAESNVNLKSIFVDGWFSVLKRRAATHTEGFTGWFHTFDTWTACVLIFRSIVWVHLLCWSLLPDVLLLHHQAHSSGSVGVLRGLQYLLNALPRALLSSPSA